MLRILMRPYQPATYAQHIVLISSNVLKSWRASPAMKMFNEKNATSAMPAGEAFGPRPRLLRRVSYIYTTLDVVRHQRACMCASGDRWLLVKADHAHF